MVTEPAGPDRGADAILGFAGFEMQVAVQVKTRANPATAWQLVREASARPDTPVLLIAGETTAEAREILERHGIAVIDGLGHAHIELPGLLFHLEGNRSRQRSWPARLSLLLQPSRVLSTLRDFVLFDRPKIGARAVLEKLIARYPQVEGVEAIFRRAMDPTRRQGLIWHHQGTGKTLLMAFAALRLLNDPATGGPTVLIVLDRVDLVEQTVRQFQTAGLPRLRVAGTRNALRQMLAEDQRGVIVTTIFRFDAPCVGAFDMPVPVDGHGEGLAAGVLPTGDGGVDVGGELGQAGDVLLVAGDDIRGGPEILIPVRLVDFTARLNVLLCICAGQGDDECYRHVGDTRLSVRALRWFGRLGLSGGLGRAAMQAAVLGRDIGAVRPRERQPLTGNVRTR